MTSLERRAAVALYGCRFIPGCWAKRFARDMFDWSLRQPEKPLTEKQERALWENVWRYRRQIPKGEVLNRADEFVNGALSLEF